MSGAEGGVCLRGGHRGPFWVMDMFYIFVRVVATWLHAFVEPHENVYVIYTGVHTHPNSLKCTFKMRAFFYVSIVSDTKE